MDLFERLRIFLSWVDRTISLEDEIKFIKTSGFWNNRPMLSYGIFHFDKIVGNITAHNIILDNKTCELGYWIHSKYEGQGLISDAVSTLEQALFESGFIRIEIHCNEKNTRSIEVAKRNNYKFEKKVKERLPESESESESEEEEMMIFVKNK